MLDVLLAPRQVHQLANTMQSRHMRPRMLQEVMHAWLANVPVLGASSLPCQLLGTSCSAATPLRRRMPFQEGLDSLNRICSVHSLCTHASALSEGNGNTAAPQQQARSRPTGDNTQSGNANPLDSIIAGSAVTCMQLLTNICPDSRTAALAPILFIDIPQ